MSYGNLRNKIIPHSEFLIPNSSENVPYDVFCARYNIIYNVACVGNNVFDEAVAVNIARDAGSAVGFVLIFVVVIAVGAAGVVPIGIAVVCAVLCCCLR